MDATSDALSFGPFHLDLVRGELLNAGELVSLAPKPLALLAYLATHRDRAVPKPELRRHIWPDVHVSESALASTLKDLRRALGDDGTTQKVIRTMRRRGYRFVARLDEVAAERARVTPPRARDARARPAPFVARDRELRSLVRWASAAARGRPRLVSLRGETGAGKTRLLEQLLAQPVSASFSAAVGRCDSRESLPFRPFVEALRARLADADEPAERLLGGEARLLRPFLALEAPSERRLEPVQADASRERADLFAAVTALMVRLARRRPTLLALEDLDAADPASLDLLEHLVGSLGEERESLPLLLVVTARPSDGDARLEHVLRRIDESRLGALVRLTGLGVAATGRVIDAFGLARPPRVTLAQIHELTDGNPLFIREALSGGDSRAAFRSDSRRGERRRVDPPRERRDGLRAAVAARIATLSAECREALRAAALLGERFGLLALGAVTRRGEEAARAALAEAERAEIVTRDNRSFRFAHPLFREVVGDTIDERARRELHRDVAGVLEDLYASAPGDHALEIARHLIEAGDLVAPERVLAHARRAGEQAASLCAWRDAARFHEAAVSAAESLPLDERGELHLSAGLAAHHDYDAERALRHYARAADAFAEARDDLGLARALMLLARARLAFPSASARLDVRPLEDVVTRLGESQPALRALLLGTIAEAHWVAGDVELAREAAERAVALGDAHGDPVVSHHAHLGLGLARLARLEVAEALDGWLEAAALARRSRDPWLEAAPAARIALALLHLGRLDEARARGRAAVELARRAHNAGELGFACAQLAALEGVTGAFQESEHYAAASLESLERAGDPTAAVLALTARACAAAHRGAWSEARAALERLVTPDGGKPGALAEFLAAAFGEVIAARAARRELDARRVTGLVGALRDARLDPHLLDALCGLVEASEALGEPALAVTPEAMLRQAFAQGVTFTSGWVYLVPRMLGRCAALGGRASEAEAWFERAIELARESGARVELGLSLADRARANRRRAARDLDEAIRIFQELGMRPALRDALELRQSLGPRG